MKCKDEHNHDHEKGDIEFEEFKEFDILFD